jgi:hypothetical protein
MKETPYIQLLKTNDLARTIEFTEAEDMGKPLSLEDLTNYAELSYIMQAKFVFVL